MQDNAKVKKYPFPWMGQGVFAEKEPNQSPIVMTLLPLTVYLVTGLFREYSQEHLCAYCPNQNM